MERARCEGEQYDRSLLRLYGRLGRAATYRDIVEAVRPEIERMLGYESIWFQLARGDLEDLLLLDAGGPMSCVERRFCSPQSRHVEHTWAG